MNNQKTAKEIFWEYSCNHFFLDRDGLFDEYVRLGGNKPIEEAKWRLEYIDHWFKRISQNEIVAFHNLASAEAFEILEPLININDFRDDYIKFWYAFNLKKISNHSSDQNLKKKANQRARNIIKELSEKKINLIAESRSAINSEMMSAFNATKPEDYVQNYSKAILLRQES